MFFQELAGLSKFDFYFPNSLPLLSHIPVERSRTNRRRVIGEVSVCFNGLYWQLAAASQERFPYRVPVWPIPV